MARTAITAQNLSSTGTNPTPTLATVDGHMFPRQPGYVLEINNGGGVSTTVTFDVPGTIDGLVIPDKSESIAAAGRRFFHLGDKDVYTQSDGNVYVNCAPQASVNLFLYRV